MISSPRDSVPAADHVSSLSRVLWSPLCEICVLAVQSLFFALEIQAAKTLNRRSHKFRRGRMIDECNRVYEPSTRSFDLPVWHVTAKIRDGVHGSCNAWQSFNLQTPPVLRGGAIPMSSPFPGMDPYLEAHWGDIHTRLMANASRKINLELPDDLQARVRRGAESDRVRCS